MGAVIGLVNKNGEDVTIALSMMFDALSFGKAESYELATASGIRRKKSCERLLSQKLDSNTGIGYASKFSPREEKRSQQFGTKFLVFEGTMFHPKRRGGGHPEIFAHRVSDLTYENLRKVAGQAEGDFAFIAMSPDGLIAGRDLLGSKPFYYGENATWAGLASERKVLWKIGIKNTETFPPGTIAKIDSKGFKFSSAKSAFYSTPQDLKIEDASTKLEEMLRKSLSLRTAGLESVAVAFSGGLDSSIISSLVRESRVNTQLIHVSLAGCPETEHAKKVAHELELPLNLFTYTEADVLETIPRVLYLIEECDPLKTCIGIPIYWIAERARQLKLHVILTGQGADELFAGYRKYVDDFIDRGPSAVQDSLLRDITNMYRDNLERDSKICNFHGLELRLPFLTRKLVKFALSLPIALKLRPTPDTLRKLVLRRVGHNLGLPKSTFDRPKKAIQYATGVNQVITKTAKKQNLSVNEFLRTVYRRVFPEENIA